MIPSHTEATETKGCGAEDRQTQRVLSQFAKAQEYSAGYRGRTPIAHFFSTRIRRVLELMGEFERGRVLDVGCGPAMIGRAFRGKRIEYTGVDMSAEMVAACREAFGGQPAFRFAVGRIEGLEFAADTFDVVLALGVLEYVLDGPAALREVRRVLKPNGVLIASMLNDRSPYRLWQERVYWKALNGLGRLRRLLIRGAGSRGLAEGRPGAKPQSVSYDEPAFRRLLASAGMVVEDLVYYDMNLMLPPLDALLPGLSVGLSERLEGLGRSRLRKLGTGFLARARKMDSCHAPSTSGAGDRT